MIIVGAGRPLHSSIQILGEKVFVMNRNLIWVSFALVTSFLFVTNNCFSQIAFEAGNLLVSADRAEFSQEPGKLREYGLSGNLIQTIDIPSPPGGDQSSQVIHAVDVDSLGRAIVRQTIDGERFANFGSVDANAPQFLSTYDSIKGTWEHQSLGSQTQSLLFGAGTVVVDDFVFIGNHRFDVETGELTAFTPSENLVSFSRDARISSISSDGNGLLYGLIADGTPKRDIFVFDTQTLEQVSQFGLRPSTTSNGVVDSRGISVNERGEIFSISSGGVLRQFDSPGQLLNELVPNGFGSSGREIALNSEGVIAALSFSGLRDVLEVSITNEDLASATTFDLEPSEGSFGFSNRVTLAFATEPVAAVPEPSGISVVAVLFGFISCRRRRCQ